jgi:iron complex transport system substrate-binding protein
MYIKKTFFLFVMSLLSVLFVTACGNNDDSDNQTDKQTNKTVHTLVDAMGKVTMPENPKKIIAPYLEDSLVALGETPVAQWSIGETVLDYLQPQLKNVPKISWELPLEQVINHDPDLIIFSSPGAIQSGQYDEYKKIAPTYVYQEEVSSDWREQLTVMGDILNKQDDAKEALADYDAKAVKAKEKIKEAIGDETVALLWVIGEQVFLFEDDRFGANVVYHDLGINPPAFVKNLPEAAAQWDPLTLEKLPEIQADHIFLISKEGEPGLEILAKSAIWNGLEPVKNKQVYEMGDPSHWTINGLIAGEKTIDEVVKALVK